MIFILHFLLLIMAAFSSVQEARAENRQPVLVFVDGINETESIREISPSQAMQNLGYPFDNSIVQSRFFWVSVKSLKGLEGYLSLLSPNFEVTGLYFLGANRMGSFYLNQKYKFSGAELNASIRGVQAAFGENLSIVLHDFFQTDDPVNKLNIFKNSFRFLRLSTSVLGHLYVLAK